MRIPDNYSYYWDYNCSGLDVTTDTTHTLVATAIAIAPATCVTGGLYESESGAILELSCLTDFPGYSALSQPSADMTSCMETCASAYNAIFGSCVGVSYDYARCGW